MNDVKNGEKQVIRVAARTLAESVYRSGGLAGPDYSGISSIEGQRLHKKFLQIIEDRYPKEYLRSEVSLNYEVEYDSYSLQISGRCDVLIEEPGRPMIIEVKSFSGPGSRLPAGGEKVHWAQAMLYAFIHLMNMESAARPPEIKIGLSYISAESSETIDLDKIITKEQLQQFFQNTCRAYIKFAADIIKSKKARQQSGIDCRFPYQDLRDGQKHFMNEVIGAARQKGVLMVQAPTGIGKTMAALYPAVKALANNLVDHVFYLTAMTSTRLVAADAVRDMRRTGLHMKCVTIFAKEKLCLEPEIYCDTRQCPYAVSYFDNLPSALSQLFLLEDIGRDEILECARQHKLCPFELSLDLSTYCEIVICDYNYAFDPRVHLARFFNLDPVSHLLLVDEAHNLPDRSREMFSASITSKCIGEAREALKGLDEALERSLDLLLAYLDKLKAAVSDDRLPALDLVESNLSPSGIMKTSNFRAMRQRPLNLLSLLNRFNFQAYSFLENQPPWSLRKPLLNAWFPALFFLRISDQYFDGTYVTTAKNTGADLEINLMCLDASEKLASVYKDRHPAVFFSATLSPISYYQGLLYGHKNDVIPETLVLPSPFPAENLLVMTCGLFSTRYKERQATIINICKFVLRAIKERIGNYMVFLPSYSYLEQMRQVLATMIKDNEIDLLVQRPNLNESQRRKYLNRFEKFGQRTLLAMAVLGGQFSEGVDLIGEKLSGVIIIGVGLPRICPEREIMNQYFSSAIGNGYAYAYMFPGFNKVQQAAGRLIRSENDRGFILLIDDRYDQQAYQQLFPAEWHPLPVADSNDLSCQLRDFWDQG